MRQDRFRALALGLAVVSCGGSNPVDYFDASAGRAGTALAGAGGTGMGMAGSGGNGQSGSSAGGAAASAGGAAASGGMSSAGTLSAGSPSAGGAGEVQVDPKDLEPCVPDAETSSTMSGPFGTTGSYCLRVTSDIVGWGCSNFEGRTIKVNDQPVICAELPLPDKLHGAYYFDVSAGAYGYASLYWFR